MKKILLTLVTLICFAAQAQEKVSLEYYLPQT